MADIPVTITFKDAHVQTILNAINACAGKTLEIEVHGAPMHFTFSYDPKQETETQLEYGQRVIKTLLRALVRMVDLNEDRTRYEQAIAAVSLPTQDIPDDIVE